MSQHDGLLCEPKDTLSLTQAMEKMLLLPELERQAMGKKGREIVLNTFDQKIITDIGQRVYIVRR